MSPVLSPNSKAILLLTAPLIVGRGPSSPDLLSPAEYKRLARHLREFQHEPADLLAPGAANLLRACQPVIDESRLQRLLDRGFLLGLGVGGDREVEMGHTHVIGDAGVVGMVRHHQPQIHRQLAAAPPGGEVVEAVRLA